MYFYSSWVAGQVAGRSSRELLAQVARGARSFRLNVRSPPLVALLWRQSCLHVACAAFHSKSIPHFSKLPQHIARRRGILYRWKYRRSLSGRQLVELFYVGVVAEGVGPPAADEVETCSGHRLQQIVATVCGASQLSSFFLCGLSMGGLVGGRDGDLRYGAEVGFVLKDHVFVGCGRRVEGAVV